jgi:hypothetical protein
MNRSALLVSTAIGLTLAAGGPVQGLIRKLPHDGSLKHLNAQRAPNAPARPARDSRPSHRDGLKMTSTFIFQSDQTVALQSGFTVDSQTSVSCKASCVVEIQAQMNFLSYYSYNSVALCPVIDGYFTNGSCFFEGSIPSGGFHPVTLLTSQSVGSGTHLAAMYLYTMAPAYLGTRQTDYHTYK